MKLFSSHHLTILIGVVVFSGGVNEYTSATETLSQDNNDGSSKMFILDVDAGVDDATAILYFLGAEKLLGNFRLIGITCVSGNTEVDNCVINVLKTLKVVGRLDIPVYKGCDSAMVKESQRDYYFGEDGFGDFYYPDPPSLEHAKKKHAVNALINQVKKSPGEISLICLAPLTNIAMATRMYPLFLSQLREIFILGGAAEGFGLSKPGVEFNFYMDPEAVFVVLSRAEETGKRITLLPSESFFIRNVMPMDWRLHVLGAVKSAAMNLIIKAEEKSLAGDFWYSADPILAAVALNSSLITVESSHSVKMETCGTISRGAIFVDYTNISNTSIVSIVRNIDMETYKKLLLNYLS